MIFLSERKLAEYLHIGAVTERQELCYLLIASLYLAGWNTSIVTHFFYDEKINVYDHLSDIVDLAAIAVTIFYANFLNSKGDGRHFIARYVCLSIPIGIKAIFLSFFMGIFVGVLEHIKYGRFLEHNEGSLNEFLACCLIELFVIWRYAVAFKIASGMTEK